MRLLLALIILIATLAPAQAETLPKDALPKNGTNSPEAGLKWMKAYQDDPKPGEVPGLIRRLSEQGAFDNPENAGVYVGFLAGVLGANPERAASLAADTTPLPFKDQWLLVRAIAYSGLENWQQVMRDVSPKLPERQHLMRYYIADDLPTLDEIRYQPREASTYDKVRRAFRWETYFGEDEQPEKPAEITYATHPELIDIHWGFYFATGADRPIERIVVLLPWSKERDDLEKLTVGGMAKFTLAVNASRDARLLDVLRRIRPRLSDSARPILSEVIMAAETADTARLHQEVMAAIEKRQQKGPASLRTASKWTEAGQVALSLGCVGAAAAGQVQFGVPCVVGGALSGAALKYLGSP